MIEIIGKHNTAKVFTDTLEETSRLQIKKLCDQPFVDGSTIRLMPDVHAGVGCTIGTTMTMDEIVANIAPTARIMTRIKPVYNFKAAE
jgi:RNA-splicing ligase RtcB